MSNETANMVEVKGLCKSFHGQLALEDVSFDVKQGEILGFLGPNGAGKTTTMRILTGYLPASSGSVSVNGYSASTDSLEIRKQIGYMPESVPLYPEMRVREYLGYRARLKGLSSKALRERRSTVLEQCGLEAVHRQVIGSLSRGYHQRVGLADALLNEPPLLILDEPSVGLDPNQIREVRELIRSLAGKHTVILSSHILPEVELVASRVLILDQGRIVASDSTRRLRQSGEARVHVRMELQSDAQTAVQVLMNLPEVMHVELKSLPNGWSRFDIEMTADIRPQLFKLCAKEAWVLREMRKLSSSLEEVFIRLTKAGGTIA